MNARIAKAGGATILRGGAFKPRTSPYAFQGLEEEGLKYIRQAADELDMQVITEVMDEANLELVAKYSDIYKSVRATCKISSYYKRLVKLENLLA